MKNSLLTAMLVFAFILTTSAQLEPGDKAMDFTLKNVDNTMVSLSDYSSKKGVIVVFTCNPCPFAKAYEERIIKIHNYYGPKGYPVVAINPNDASISPDDTFEKMQKLAKEKDYPFPYLKDVTQEVYKAYGATRTPHIYLLKNEGGTFKVAFIGAIDDNAMATKANEINKRYLEDAIGNLMKGMDPDPAVVKAIGCTIKTKKKV